MSSNKIPCLCSRTKDYNSLTDLNKHHLHTGIALLLCFGNRAELLLKLISKQCKKFMPLTVNIPQQKIEGRHSLKVMATSCIIDEFSFNGAILMDANFF